MTGQGIWLGALWRIRGLKARQDDAQRNSGDAMPFHVKTKEPGRVSRVIHVFQAERRSHEVMLGQKFAALADQCPSCGHEKVWK